MKTITDHHVLVLAACLAAVTAVPGAAMAQTRASPQTQAPPQMRAQAAQLAQTCFGDYQRLCFGVRPGGGRVLACLQQHADALSQPCAAVIPTAVNLKAKATAQGVMPQ